MRRRVITEVYNDTTVKEIPIINYLRWSMRRRDLSQLPTYVQVPTEVTDQQVLAQHPILETWETVVPYLVKWHPEYGTNPEVTKLYNEMI